MTLGWLWYDFGMIMVCFWDEYGLTLGRLWYDLLDDYGMLLG